MKSRLAQGVHAVMERRFPERRLFLKSDTETRFIRLRPGMQLGIWSGATIVVGWAIVATAILLMDSIGAGNFRAQAQRDRVIYEDRLNEISAERDTRAQEAVAAQERFAAALEQISNMQSDILSLEDRRREAERGLDVVQATLLRVMNERDEAQAAIDSMTGEDGSPVVLASADDEMTGTVEILSDALARTAEERDVIAADADFALSHAAELELELRLMEDRNDEIFRQLEEAMLVSVEPLDDMFRAAGMNPDDMISAVRRGYSGMGGPLTPLAYSTMNGAPPDPDTMRANGILSAMDNINLYRIAAEKAPFSMPVRDSFRYTSPFGARWGRMHEGVDMAGPIGTPVYATADGVVTHAGWSSGYGRLIKIQHEFGIETRFGHLNAIDVQVGQRVSQGDHIGDMGNSGRSTGPHLHYEVRVGGEPINPMIYIRAGQDVF
ncbi:DUF5930 domain-containing protein [Pseudoroseicyclus sp. H15]